jgi:hypothetical protein
MVTQTRILKHLTKYNILTSEQYGFRIGLKTDNAIYKLTTGILNAMKKTTSRRDFLWFEESI